MPLIATLTILISFLLMFSCSPQHSSSDMTKELGNGFQDSHASFPEFWKLFQAALKKKDASAIADMTRFPLLGGLETISDFSGVEQRPGFERKFNRLFPDDVIKTLLSQTPELDRFDNDPITWNISHKTTTTLEGGDSTDSVIIYYFTRLADGSIKLTLIEFAG